MAEKKKTEKTAESYNLPAAWQNAWKISAGVGLVGLAGAGYGMTIDPTRFTHSYLFGFYVFLTIALGSLFFVLIQRLTSAHWSVTVRRTAEFFAAGLPLFAILFLPILLKMDNLFPWLQHHGAHEEGHHGSVSLVVPRQGFPGVVGEAHAQEAHAQEPPAAQGHGAAADDRDQRPGRDGRANPPSAHGAKGGGHGEVAHGTGPVLQDPYAIEHEELMAKKAPYLNRTFFLARAAAYFVIWTLLGINFFNFSTKEDKSKDPSWTLKAQRWAPPSMFLFAFSLTFAAFDWMMSLDPTWFSTIYGVYVFATSVVSSLAVIIVVTMALRDSGPLKDVVTVEHYHDLGKLMYGFNIFWAYIGFSQMMLIWYAALPEETPFYHRRWDFGPWAGVSMLVLFGHFVVPFLFLTSRVTKRRLPFLRIGAAWMLLMHVVDMYWFVMPNFTYTAGLDPDSFAVSWIDGACFLGVGGVYLAFVFWQMTKYPLIPVGDPRLQRSLHFVNS